MKCEFYLLEKMYSVNVDDIQAKEMAKFCNEASGLYYKYHDEFLYKEPEENPHYKEEHDLLEKMVRVVIPDYKLNEKYSRPVIEPINRNPRIPPPTLSQYIPSPEYEFVMKFENIYFVHKH